MSELKDRVDCAVWMVVQRHTHKIALLWALLNIEELLGEEFAALGFHPRV